jgi:lipopolysaccharide/colanic/teichoic acid biosynthesis glycosyltransferase
MINRKILHDAVIVLGDLILLYAGLWLALSLRHLAPVGLPVFQQYVPAFGLLFLCWMVVFHIFGLYDLRRLRSTHEMLKGLTGAAAFNLAWSGFFFYMFSPYSFIGTTPRTNLLLTFVIGHTCVFLWRRLAFALLTVRRFQRSLSVLADRSLVRDVREELDRHPHLGFKVMPWSGTGTDGVIVDEQWVERNWWQAEELLAAAAENRVPVMTLSCFYEKILGKVPLEEATRAGLAMDAVYSRLGGWYLYAKRTMDFILAVVLLVILSPVVVLTMAVVWMVDGAPVLLGQRREGMMDREFVMWKVRTSPIRPEPSARFARTKAWEYAPTPLGRWLRRFQIDLLPQLVNVIKGEMALVGPRPEISAEVAVLTKKIPHYGLRNLIGPGITGWAQLNFRATNDPKDLFERFRYDLFYIKNISPALDLTIMLRTVRHAFLADAPYHTVRSDFMRGSKRS